MPSRTTWYILTPTLAVSGLLLAVGMSGAWRVHQVNRDVSNSLVEIVDATQSAERLVFAIRDMRVKLHRFVDDGDISHLGDARSTLAAIDEELEKQKVLDERGEFSKLRDRLEILRQRLERTRVAEARREETRQLLNLLDGELLVPAEQVLQRQQQMVSDAGRQNRQIADRIGLGLLLLGLCGAVAGVLIGFGMARGVHRSLVEISLPVHDIAGRLNEVVGPITVSSNAAELGELDGALRLLADKTADVVKRLQESQQETLRSEQFAAIGQLAAGLAHELRNPLMSVKLIVQTAVERGGASLSPRDLAVIDDEVTRLEKMLQTFLDFARPPQPEKQIVDIGQLAENTVEFVRCRADQQNVRLWFSVPRHEMSVEADSSQMRQVLLNLLLNALDALPGGGNVWLELAAESERTSGEFGEGASAEPVAHGGGNGQAGKRSWVAIRVADDGPGVAPDVAERIFQPFVSTKVTGIGLGLSISRRIVQSHNGRIEVRNRDEGGAEFTVYLPSDSIDHERVASGGRSASTPLDSAETCSTALTRRESNR